MQENFSGQIQAPPMPYQEPIYYEQKKQLKKSVSFIGFGLTAMMLLTQGIQVGAIWLLDEFVPSFSYKYADIINYFLMFIPLYLIGLPIFLLITHKINQQKSFPHEKRKMKIGYFLQYMCVCFPVMYVSNIPSVLITLIQQILKGGDLQQSTPLDGIMQTNIFLRLLFVAILAPVLEEIVFRGILLNKLRAYGEGVAIFVSALAFGLFHGNFSQMFYAFSLGVIFAYITLKTGRIIYSMILHAIINGFSSVFLVSILDSQNPIGISLAGCIIITLIILGVTFFCKNRKKIYVAKTADGIPISKKIGWALNTPGMYVFMSVILILSVVSLVVS